MRTVHLHDLGLTDHVTAYELNMRLYREMLDRKTANHDLSDEAKIPTQDHVVLCEVAPTITTGEEGSTEFLLRSPEELSDLGITLFRTGRGGDISFHGPGQLLCSGIFDLEHHGHSLVGYIHQLEQVMIDLLLTYGIQGSRIHKMNGVWLDADDPTRIRKICTLGVQAERWVTVQGLGLNVSTDLSYYQHIVLCGMADKGITSMEKELGRAVDMNEVKQRLIASIETVYGVSVV
ncbi:MAG: lipoyl(octanoyl) transferase LipB [Flavobacteriales bacterium]|nr:lipoyl(octanoyl) transferase LipB [Flavobacteriales bacterium]